MLFFAAACCFIMPDMARSPMLFTRYAMSLICAALMLRVICDAHMIQRYFISRAGAICLPLIYAAMRTPLYAVDVFATPC